MNRPVANQTPKTESNKSESPQFVITARQSASIVASTAIGVGVLTLPRTSVDGIGEGGWLSPVWGGIVACIVMYVISKLTLRFQGESFVEYGARILGSERHPWIGRVIGFPFFICAIVMWALVTGMVARVFGEVVITTLLPRTPLEVVIGTMLIVCFLIVMHDVEVLARVNEFLLPLILIPILLIAISSFKSAEIDNLLPLFHFDVGSMLKGTLSAASSYLGVEIMLVFSDRLTPAPNKLVMLNSIGVAIPVVVYTLITIAGISVFGVKELGMLTWPTLELVKTTEVPGAILERVESLFLAVWVVAVFTTVGNFYYAAVRTTTKVFRVSSQRWIASLLLPFIYFISMKIPNLKALFEYQGLLGKAVGIFAFTVPLCFLLLAILRKQKVIITNGQSGRNPSDTDPDNQGGGV